jgi:NAD(P)-dependent dehydrogenase (short-subunit alcohol dehydrogenase family)
MDNGGFATELAELTRGYPDGRPGTASEVAEAVAFPAGPGAAHIHGATIPVDGERRRSKGRPPVNPDLA